MRALPDTLMLAVVIAAFLVGYAVVAFVVGRLKRSRQDSEPTTNEAKDAEERARNSARQWEERNRQQEEEFRRQEQTRREREQERIQAEEERRRQQEESRNRSTSDARNQTKDEKYYGNILGLRGHVTPDDVRKRYRNLVVQYHPDKVNHLGPKLRALAEKEMKDINEAFEYFKHKYG